MKLFGTDGVRGKAGEFLTAELAMRVAMAAGIYFRKNSVTNMILVGKDTRRSGYMIETAIVAGLTSVGYNVRQIGPMPTPAIAFLTEDMRCDAGIMISASHNPYYDNGIKFFNSEGFKLDEKEEAQIEKIYFSDELIAEARTKMMQIGAAKRVDDVIGRYIVHIKNSFPKQKTLHGLRVVLDCANGASYRVAPTVFNELGAETIVIGDEPNGKNINDACGALSPQNLASEVKRLRADVGFAFDGDADRCLAVDENGSVVNGDKILYVCARNMQTEGRFGNSKVVTTVMSNLGLYKALDEAGIGYEKTDVGDKYVAENMRANGHLIGGEQSGHIIFGKYANTGDGLLTAIKLMQVMLDRKKTLSELAAPVREYPQQLTNVEVDDKDATLNDPAVVAAEQAVTERLGDEGRILVRKSGTEPVLRVMVEAATHALCEENVASVIDAMQKSGHLIRVR